MNAARLLHMGGAVVDFVYHAPALPEPGREVVAERFSLLPGGGFNLMLAARRCGMQVAYGGPHGDGPMGELIRASLREADIDILRAPTSGIDTGNCVVAVTPDGERSFLSWPGAEGRLDEADLAAIRPEGLDHVFVSGYTLSYPQSGDALARWLEFLDPSVLVAFDPAPVVASIPADLLRGVLARTTWLSANLVEAETLTGKATPAEQAELLLGNLCPIADGVLLRDGSQGTWLAPRGAQLRHVPAFAVEAVDTTGAGDTHFGSFLAMLAVGKEPFAAALFANAAAAISVTRRGGASAPEAGEVESFLGKSAETV